MQGDGEWRWRESSAAFYESVISPLNLAQLIVFESFVGEYVLIKLSAFWCFGKVKIHSIYEIRLNSIHRVTVGIIKIKAETL